MTTLRIEEMVENLFWKHTDYTTLPDGEEEPFFHEESLKKDLIKALTQAHQVALAVIGEIYRQQKECRELCLFSHRHKKCLCYDLERLEIVDTLEANLTPQKDRI